MYDLVTNTVRASNEWWQLRGRPPETARTWAEWKEHLHPDDVAALSSSLNALRLGREDRFSVEYRERSDSGDWVWISAHGWREDDESGGSRIVGADTDISHLKWSEQAVTALSRRLELALRASGVGLWEIHLDTGRFVCDEALRGMYGFGPECGETICFGMWRSRLHPEDRERAVRAAHEAMTRCESLEQAFRIVLPAGDVRHIITSCRYYLDPDGLPRFLGVDRDVTHIYEREAQLQSLAYSDVLTGLANRAFFQHELQRVVEGCEPGTPCGALLLLDLDRFKEINDSLGHVAGDELLQQVAEVLEERLHGRHFVARLGGDEFAVIVEHHDARSSAVALAEDLVQSLNRTIRLRQGDVVVSTSIGIARIPEDGSTTTELLRNADLALYRAKAAGRSCAEFFQEELSRTAQLRLETSTDLRRALQENRGLSLHYQPQVELATGKVTGFEALLRWQHETRGLISPAEFIPVAERSHLICDLGSWVLKQATHQARRWLDAGEPAGTMSVNVSPAQIWLSDFVNDVARTLEEARLPPHMLCLELTESFLADQAETRVRNVLERLSALGVQLALDDFGTGYSSLGYLRQLPFASLKVDRVFVRGATSSKRSRELLTGIVALGRGLDMSVVAEGAEEDEELELLRRIGCDRVQGYVFARPSPAEQAMAFARRSAQSTSAA